MRNAKSTLAAAGFALLALLNCALALTTKQGADSAYQSFISRFWVGPAANGHLALINGNSLGAAYVPAGETEPRKGWLWQYAEGWMPIYAKWKVTGDADALLRLKSQWGWVKSRWSLADMGICDSSGNQAATTLDDADWAVRGLIALYEATSDPLALNYAKAAIDCFNAPGSGFLDTALGGQAHWYDANAILSASWSGGVATLTLAQSWAVQTRVGQPMTITGMTPSAYNGQVIALAGSDQFTLKFALASDPGPMTVAGFYHSAAGKGMNSLNFAVAEILYYRAACPLEGGACPTAAAYYTKAKAELDWANAILDRSANSNCPVANDHLFWASVNAGTPPLPGDAFGGYCSRPFAIAKTASVVGLFANMGGAVANALVSINDNDPAYAAKAVANAASILAREIDTCGAFLDDRDARGNGFVAYDYLAYVLPLLSGSTLISTQAAFIATARATLLNNRGADGSFGGDWCGPWNGVWTQAGFHPDQLEISAQAATVAITAAAF